MVTQTPAPIQANVGLTAIPEQEHRERAAAHQDAVDRLTEDFLARRHAGTKHPVEDFLFTYYSHSPGKLSRWHPGAGVALEGEAVEQAEWKHYRRVPAGVSLDVEGFRRDRASMIGFARRLLSTTAAAPAQLGCFGLHEWAMVYKSVEHGQRHDQVPLRLGAAGTDEVVEAANIRCTHFDAYRFYTPSARPLNALEPTRESQTRLEQPGCLHANMDLYKWAYKLIPAVSSDLLLECFDLASRIRELDMRASPYDLADWGYEPVQIETPAGRAAYARAQKGFAEESQVLRAKLLTVLDQIEEPADERVR
ncbi:3-methyladenine DNA glycosylase [Nesterenkonia lutea]|uniref:Phage tail protein X n=1 Tax=Nesterenkonia lutea TaxID=272919 RepID=A0ABR9JGZ3_9MICC|nr:3-methyladenine DNA glycosylase [Nesterenkonia lutea]MBE1524742.1 phage tail protein X [Nesterenkonia lutea]